MADDEANDVVLEFVMAGHFASRAGKGLVEQWLVLENAPAAGFEDEFALRGELDPVGPFEAERDGARIGARGDDEIVFQLRFVPMVLQIDAGVEGLEADAGKGRHARPPARRLGAKEIVYGAGKGLETGGPGARVRPGKGQAQKASRGLGGVRLNEGDHSLSRREVNAVVPAAGDELEARVSLAAVGFEEGGELAIGSL